MARPRSDVRLSFDEDTVRIRRNNWSDSFRVEWRWPCSQKIAEILETETSYWCNPQVDSMVVDWRDSCRAIQEEHYQNAYWAPTYMGPIRSWYDEEGQRAQTLLIECLSPAQKEEYSYTRSFTVISPSKRTYRIEFTRTYNVKLIDDTKRSLVTYCAGPLEEVPIADMMLSQKLMLENDEERFLRIANIQGGSLDEFVRGAREGGILDEFRRLLSRSAS